MGIRAVNGRVNGHVEESSLDTALKGAHAMEIGPIRRIGACKAALDWAWIKRRGLCKGSRCQPRHKGADEGGPHPWTQHKAEGVLGCHFRWKEMIAKGQKKVERWKSHSI